MRGTVVFHGFDGYTTNVRLEQFDQPDVFLVHEWEGKPLSRAHGGPVRMLIPRLFVEIREVAAAHPVHAGRSPGFLGAARLSQQWRSLAGGALQLSRRFACSNK